MGSLEVYKLNRNNLGGTIELISKLLRQDKLTEIDLEALTLLQDNPLKLFSKLQEIPAYQKWADKRKISVRSWLNLD